MSQLNVNAIYDASGGDSVDVFSENAAKVWIIYDQATPSIVADFGVDTVTDNATGHFTLNYTTNFASANYAPVATNLDNTVASAAARSCNGVDTERATSSCGFISYWMSAATNKTNADYDAAIAIYGDQ